MLSVSGSVTLDRAENEWVWGMWSVPTGIQNKILQHVNIRGGSSAQSVTFYEITPFVRHLYCDCHYVIDCIPMPTCANC